MLALQTVNSFSITGTPFSPQSIAKNYPSKPYVALGVPDPAPAPETMLEPALALHVATTVKSSLIPGLSYGSENNRYTY